ncbi:hypothetical protein V8F20_007282 [Naviculisporaceae sp. PSN 640]
MTSPNPNTPPPPPHHIQTTTNNASLSTSTTPASSSGNGNGALSGWSKTNVKSPFPDPLQLKPTLIPSQPSTQTRSSSGSTRSFLKPTDNSKPFLPGQPRIIIKERQDSVEKLDAYLKRSHLTKEIDILLPYMRYIFVQTPSYRHIAPLHHQKAREREVIVDEHPGLHLVWYYQTIFIKPIPAYLFSPSFWSYIEEKDKDVFEASLGFMRSYTFLIQYETDYLVACEKRLIPKLPFDPSPNKNKDCCCCQKAGETDPEDGKRFPTYEEFCLFMAPFHEVTDQQLMDAQRFHFGELRLTRINRTAFMFRLKLAYFHIYPQWGSFLQHVLAPVITVFAVATVVLNSMQVSLAALDMSGVSDGDGWPRFVNVSKWFPIAVIILIAVVLTIGVSALLVMAVKDWMWVEKTNRKKKNNDPHFGEKSHGMIW